MKKIFAIVAILLMLCGIVGCASAPIIVSTASYGAILNITRTPKEAYDNPIVATSTTGRAYFSFNCEHCGTYETKPIPVGDQYLFSCQCDHPFYAYVVVERD